MGIGTSRSYNITDDSNNLERLRLHAGVKAGVTDFDTELKEYASVASAHIDRLLTKAGEGTVPLTGTIPLEVLTAEAMMGGGAFKERAWSSGHDAPKALVRVEGKTAEEMVIDGSLTRRRGLALINSYIQHTYLDDPDATSPVGIFEAVEDTPRWK